MRNTLQTNDHTPPFDLSLFDESDNKMTLSDALRYIEDKYGLEHRNEAMKSLENIGDFE